MRENLQNECKQLMQATQIHKSSAHMQEENSKVLGQIDGNSTDIMKRKSTYSSLCQYWEANRAE